ncbi:MAG: hypothetical protein JNJ65_01640 [Cyclobacteriaceae bacterium]|nr:hypothetical protein [Cyclobacteriaceae bacterium]
MIFIQVSLYLRFICIVLFELFISGVIVAQELRINKLEASVGLSYGSENNYGNPGFMLNSSFTYHLNKSFSVSPRLGFFQSMPWFHPEPFYFSFNSISVGLNLGYTTRFDEDKKFVKLAIGPTYFSYHYLYSDMNVYYDDVQKFGYGISLEGGGAITSSIDLTLMLQVYSYEIFADLFVIGPNVIFKL